MPHNDTERRLADLPVQGLSEGADERILSALEDDDAIAPYPIWRRRIPMWQAGLGSAIAAGLAIAISLSVLGRSPAPAPPAQAPNELFVQTSLEELVLASQQSPRRDFSRWEVHFDSEGARTP